MDGNLLQVTLGIVVILLVVLQGGLTYLFIRNRADQRKWTQRLEAVARSRDEANRRLEAVLRASRVFVEASSEKELIDQLLHLSMDLTGASGASFVPLDEFSQPVAAIRQGEFPFPAPDAWLEYLASPSIRHSCNTCKNYESLVMTCPLLKGPYAEALNIYCVPLRRGEKELGLLNVYGVDAKGPLGDEAQTFLRSLVDATALALEGIRLRQRELDLFSQIRAVREKADLHSSLRHILANTKVALQADFGLIYLPGIENGAPFHQVREQGAYSSDEWILSSEIHTGEQTRIIQILNEVLASGSILARNGTDGPYSDPASGFYLAAPLVYHDKPVMGVILVGKRKPGGFSHRQQVLMESVASQAAQLVEYVDQIAKLEYRTLTAERQRLSREIHDGLAQTLAFLKLQLAQMIAQLDRQELDRLKQATRLCYQTLSEAYLDVRETIDWLRIAPQGEHDYRLNDWLQQSIHEFQEGPGQDLTLQVISEINTEPHLPAEVHAQLIRIVQEALSNVRKHANANRVWVTGSENEGDLILEIRDDGTGFTPEEVPGPSRHGLRGMRERAELIGADFQVISFPSGGTTIRVRLPLEDRYKKERKVDGLGTPDRSR